MTFIKKTDAISIKLVSKFNKQLLCPLQGALTNPLSDTTGSVYMLIVPVFIHYGRLNYN